MSKLRVAIIGCGGISRSHAVGYQSLADQVEVAWCVDPNPAAASERAEPFGARTAADYPAILDDVDAVDICTPHHLHYAAARDALAAGCHVLVEKPMANHEAECLDLVERAAAADRQLMVGYVLRYEPAIEAFIEHLSQRASGDLIQIASSVEAYLTAASLPWAAKRDQLGGGVLFSHGCHTVDCMVAAAGEPTTVACLGNNINAEWMEGEGTAQVIIQFADGALGHHTSSWATRHAHRVPSLRAWCREAFLEVTGRNLVRYQGSDSDLLFEAQPDLPPAMTRQVAHFVECCLTGQPTRTNGAAAIRSLRVIWGAYRSREEGRIVAL